MFDSLETTPEATIKVVGVGGAGGNAVNAMVRTSVEGVSFIAINTDAQALKKSEADVPIQIGLQQTNGYGCGAEPAQGYNSAKESESQIREELVGTDMLFIAAGMGGGTGTGASPYIAEIAKDLGILTVAVVTKPFAFEGRKRLNAAEVGINELRSRVDSLIVIENDKLLKVLPNGTPMMQAFREADNVLCKAVFAIAEVITTSGLVNVDFADVKTVMQCTGRALMGAGEGQGENRALEAAESAIESPLLEDFEMKAAKGILCTISHAMDFSIDELGIIGDKVQSLASPEATVVIGTIPNADMEDRCVVTVIATGIDGHEDSCPDSVIEESQSKASNPTPQSVQSATKRSHKDVMASVPTVSEDFDVDPSIATNGNVSGEVMTEGELGELASHGAKPMFKVPSFMRNQS